MTDDRKYLLNIADGPECIQIYTSDDEGVNDWSNDLPAMYVYVALNDATVKLGPFTILRKQVEEALNFND